MPFELRPLDFKAGEQRKPAYLAVNPMGKIPAIVHRGQLVTEQVAIALFLADLFPSAGLAPALDDAARGPYLRWMVFYAACFEPAVSDRALQRDSGRPSMSPYGDYRDGHAGRERAARQRAMAARGALHRSRRGVGFGAALDHPVRRRARHARDRGLYWSGSARARRLRGRRSGMRRCSPNRTRRRAARRDSGGRFSLCERRRNAPGPVHVVGASGRSGAALCRALRDEGAAVRPGRARCGALGGDGIARQPTHRGSGRRGGAQGGARRREPDRLCAHARHTEALLASSPAPARFVLLGSTRKFTRWPDAHGLGVLAGKRRSGPPAGAASCCIRR